LLDGVGVCRIEEKKAEMMFFRLQRFTPHNLFDEQFISASVSLVALDIQFV
jgi:hypothetical protein